MIRNVLAEAGKGMSETVNVINIFPLTAQASWLKQSFNLFTEIRSSTKKNEKEKSEEKSSMKKKSKQKIDVLPHFQHNNFYKITKYSRITIFLIIYAGRNFIKISSHQPHSKEFTPYLKILVAENPK